MLSLLYEKIGIFAVAALKLLYLRNILLLKKKLENSRTMFWSRDMFSPENYFLYKYFKQHVSQPLENSTSLSIINFYLQPYM